MNQYLSCSVCCVCEWDRKLRHFCDVVLSYAMRPTCLWLGVWADEIGRRARSWPCPSQRRRWGIRLLSSYTAPSLHWIPLDQLCPALWRWRGGGTSNTSCGWVCLFLSDLIIQNSTILKHITFLCLRHRPPYNFNAHFSGFSCLFLFLYLLHTDPFFCSKHCIRRVCDRLQHSNAVSLE